MPRRFSIASLILCGRTWDSSFGNCSKERAWYRLIYLSRINDVIYVLHCFEKKSRQIPRRDFEKARQRLKAVKARLAERKKYEKQN
jgi:hypothetical protein